MEQKNIYQKIISIANEIPYLQKDKEVPTGGNRSYWAITHDKVIREIRQLMIAHLVVPEVKIIKHELEKISSTVTYKDSTTEKLLYLTKLEVIVSFVNAENPKEKVEIYSVGYGLDNQDKGAGKALSYAVKYAILKQFMIESGDEEEDRIHETIKETTKKDYVFPDIFKKYAGKTIEEVGIVDAEAYCKYLVSNCKNKNDKNLLDMVKAIGSFKINSSKNQTSTPSITTEEIPF